MSTSFRTDAFFDSLESSACDVNSAETLPPLCYTDPEFYAFEKEAIFDREWLCVGRAAWAKEPGDYFTASQVGEPIVVIRNREGVLQAMSSVCRHRAALVADGHGNARSLRCPYHHWTYSLDGKLVAAPEMDRACRFDKDAVFLPKLKLEEWLGFVFVNFDPDAPPLAPRLAALSNMLAPYELATADERRAPPEARKELWNWKVRYENANDGYHAPRLHASPVTDIYTTIPVDFPDLPPDTAGYFRSNKTLHPDFSFNVTMKASLPIFPKLSEEDRNRVLFLCVPPTLTLNCCADLVNFSIFYIEGPEEMSAVRGFAVAPGAMRDPLFEEKVARLVRGSSTVQDQDRYVDKLVQSGLRSRFAARGRYSWQEQSQRELSAWLVKRYRAAWERQKMMAHGPAQPFSAATA